MLQQHIRTHTGEPTELSPEQIAAAEIKDFPPQLPFPLPVSLPSGVAGGLPGLPRMPGSGLFPGFPGLNFPGFGSGGGGGSESQSPEMGDGSREDKDSNEDKDNSRPSSVSSSNSSMKNASLPTMTSMPSNIEAFIKSSVADSGGNRPFGLVRPFLMDKPLAGGALTIPEDLSRKPPPPPHPAAPGLSNGGKEEAAALSPMQQAESPSAKFSPVPSPTATKEDGGGDSPPSTPLPPPPSLPPLPLPLPKSEEIPKTPSAAAPEVKIPGLALDLTPRSSVPTSTPSSTSPLLPAAAPPPGLPSPFSLFSAAGFPGLLPPNPAAAAAAAAAFSANPFLGAAAAAAAGTPPSAASAALSNPFGPLAGFPFPGAPGGLLGRRKCGGALA